MRDFGNATQSATKIAEAMQQNSPVQTSRSLYYVYLPVPVNISIT